MLALSLGGTVAVRLGRGAAALTRGRDGVVASFSSKGPTAFRHELKPDLTAPGVSILSASNQRLFGSRFEAMSGTSMAAPHVAGAAALLLEEHPDWTPAQLKSALLSTAAPAWADTARSNAAPPSLTGAGRAAVDEATTPLIFTSPAAFSFGDIYVSKRRTGTFVSTIALDDAGGGAGTWLVGVDTMSAPAGVALTSAPAVSIGTGGSVFLPISVLAPAGSSSGPLEGQIRLTRGPDVRSIPFYGFVSNPELAALGVTTLRKRGRGTTADSISRVERYRFPSSPFGPAPTPTASPLLEVGGERVFRFDVPSLAVNAGVAVVPTRPGVSIDPFLLGLPDENAVLGLAATPITANGLLPSVGRRDGAAAILFPTPGRYWVSVDSGLDAAKRTSVAGPFRIHSWIDDVTPPRIELITRTLPRGRGTIAVRALDAGSGVDPLTLLLDYDGAELSAVAFDYENGVALFRIPQALPRLRSGPNEVILRASDHQEAKNILATATGFLANTSELATRVTVDASKPHVAWLVPAPTRCVPAGSRAELAASAAGPDAIAAVRFSAARKPIGLDRKPRFGDVYETKWTVPPDAQGRIRLLAEAIVGGRVVQQRVVRVRICRQPS